MAIYAGSRHDTGTLSPRFGTSGPDSPNSDEVKAEGTENPFASIAERINALSHTSQPSFWLRGLQKPATSRQMFNPYENVAGNGKESTTEDSEPSTPTTATQRSLPEADNDSSTDQQDEQSDTEQNSRSAESPASDVIEDEEVSESQEVSQETLTDTDKSSVTSENENEREDETQQTADSDEESYQFGWWQAAEEQLRKLRIGSQKGTAERRTSSEPPQKVVPPPAVRVLLSELTTACSRADGQDEALSLLSSLRELVGKQATTGTVVSSESKPLESSSSTDERTSRRRQIREGKKRSAGKLRTQLQDLISLLKDRVVSTDAGTIKSQSSVAESTSQTVSSHQSVQSSVHR